MYELRCGMRRFVVGGRPHVHSIVSENDLRKKNWSLLYHWDKNLAVSVL